ncbi:MAG: Iron transporter MagA [Opitutia bacterium UBA7350]|nr:MAG: Iron transporter MagA [Opitutae bacterium UBA7350]
MDSFSEVTLLLDLGYIILAATAFAFLGKRIKMPSLVGYLLAGLLLGPVLGLVAIGHSLEMIAELGIALLLFLVGLELSFDKIKDLGKAAVSISSFQVCLTAIGGFAVAQLLGFGLLPAIFLAATVTFSSTVVVIKLLDQKGHMHRRYARLAVGLFLGQDIVIILALTILSGLGAGSDFELAIVLKSLGVAFGGMGLLLSVVLVAARYILPRPFAWAANSPDTVFIWALCWCFLIVLLAHQLHLSLEIGAFLAGVALAQLPMHEDLHRRLHPLMTFFIAIFLVTLGIRMEIQEFSTVWVAVLVLSTFVLLIKPLIVFVILTRMRFDAHTAFHTAVATGQVSEFSFILLAMGASSGLINGTLVTLGGLVGLITIACSSYLIINADALYKTYKRTGLFRLLGSKRDSSTEAEETRERHCIVVGMNAMGRAITQALANRGLEVLAVDTDPKKLTGLGSAETFIGSVEYESVIEEIGLRRANMVISALQIEDANHLLAYRCKSYGVRCAIHAFDLSMVEDLLDLETAYLLMPSADGTVAQKNILIKEGLVKI